MSDGGVLKESVKLPADKISCGRRGRPSIKGLRFKAYLIRLGIPSFAGVAVSLIIVGLPNWAVVK